MALKVSVCIPVYGVEKYIRRCAVSLFEQSMNEGIEFIFVNDCTKDKSMDILQDVLEVYPARKAQVKIVNHPVNKGLSAARETAVKIAQGEYIAHLDSDDWVEPEMYQLLYQVAHDENADIVGCDFIIERLHASHLVKFNYNNITDILKDVISNKWGTVWKLLVRREILSSGNIIFIPEICHGEDYIYTSQCLLNAKEYIHVGKGLYHYNCENMASMMKTPSIESANQQVKATEFILNLLNERKLTSVFEYEILKRKIFCRNRFLPFGLQKWRSVYPEIINSYWRLKDLDSIKKIQYFILEHFPERLINLLIKS